MLGGRAWVDDEIITVEIDNDGCGRLHFELPLDVTEAEIEYIQSLVVRAESGMLALPANSLPSGRGGRAGPRHGGGHPASLTPPEEPTPAERRAGDRRCGNWNPGFLGPAGHPGLADFQLLRVPAGSLVAGRASSASSARPARPRSPSNQPHQEVPALTMCRTCAV